MSDQNVPNRINLTVNSAQKIPLIDGINSRDERWLVIDLSIKNGGFRNGIFIKKNNFVLLDPIANRNFSPTTKHVHVDNLWTDKRIPLNGKQQGEIVFDTPISPDTYIIIINDDNGIALGQTDIKTITAREYSPHVSDENKALMGSQNLSFVVDRLTTPDKTLSFMREAFTVDPYRSGWVSFTPEEFLLKRKGDCKDFATFFSYVLSRHGYDAKVVGLHYNDTQGGHVVSIFKDTDGQLKYMSNDKLNGFRKVNSLDDLVQMEKKRLGANLNVTVLPAGSVNTCPYCT